MEDDAADMRVLSVAFSIGVTSMACGGTPPEATTSPEPVAPMEEPTGAAERARPSSLSPALHASVLAAMGEVAQIPEERRVLLERIAAHVVERRAGGKPARLLFICTHNSRRSHMGQLWAAASAAYFGIDGVETFSGGTEATAFNPRAVAALQRAGFEIEAPEQGDNPRYMVALGEGLTSQEAFSKRYMDPPNPTEGFVAVMTCSDADQACPLVAGSDLRVALPYVDPKVSDGTPEEAATYDERSRQIAREMAYLFSKV